MLEDRKGFFYLLNNLLPVVFAIKRLFIVSEVALNPKAKGVLVNGLHELFGRFNQFRFFMLAGRVKVIIESFGVELLSAKLDERARFRASNDTLKHSSHLRWLQEVNCVQKVLEFADRQLTVG